MFSIFTKKKDPVSLVRGTVEVLNQIDKTPGKASDKIADEVAKNLNSIRVILVGDAENEPNVEQGTVATTEIYSQDLIPLLITHLAALDFETRKEVVYIFGNLLRRTTSNRFPAIEYLSKNPQILTQIIKGYQNSEIALNCGKMLQECAKNEVLTKMILASEPFLDLFGHIETGTFDVASDAFTTFKELLTQHKNISADYLEKNYDNFFERYNRLLKSDSYVIRRQALKLLGEILLDSTNQAIMLKFINERENLKLVMTLLRDKSKKKQFEAFHVFKIFVANPNKAQPILEILVQNKKALIAFLTNFQADSEDEQFNEEKQYIITQIKALPDKVN